MPAPTPRTHVRAVHGRGPAATGTTFGRYSWSESAGSTSLPTATPAGSGTASDAPDRSASGGWLDARGSESPPG
ncbi:hypothetical protein [Arthrobacter livingstonensis]|uniref:hypothetical protein n=1 Tax=Arthrobacter livingstonensis TaxID=670078 RepID=UPI0011B7A6DA|nr:hypothetical protein [Arthrobacter livingstonensis]